MDFGHFGETYFSIFFGNFGTRNSDIFGPPAGGGRGAGGGALRVGCGRSARRVGPALCPFQPGGHDSICVHQSYHSGQGGKTVN